MTDRIDYKQEWLKLGYPRGMGSSSFLHPPTAEYVRAYHFTSSAHAISTIKSRRLKVARFSEVNDPFELLALNFHDRMTRKITRKFRDAYNNKNGLLCFSVNWTNPVLWSHYAAKHMGICLGFNLRRTTVQKVEYEDNRLRQALSDNREPDIIPLELQALLARTKSRHWIDEEELRVFIGLARAIRDQALNFWPFSNDLQLAEVILGPRCGLALSDVRSLTAKTSPEAVVFKARLAFRSFRVVVDGKTIPTIASKAA